MPEGWLAYVLQVNMVCLLLTTGPFRELSAQMCLSVASALPRLLEIILRRFHKSSLHGSTLSVSSKVLVEVRALETILESDSYTSFWSLASQCDCVLKDVWVFPARSLGLAWVFEAASFCAHCTFSQAFPPDQGPDGQVL